MDAASYSIQAAEDLYGEGSQQVLSVQDAWEAVGIYMDPRLAASDTLMRFEAQVDDSDYQLLVLRNKGIENLEITDFSFSDPDRFIFQPPRATPFQIEGGDSLRFWIVFSPDQDSLYDEILTIETSDPLNPVQTISLSAQGTLDVTGLPEGIQAPGEIELSVSPNPFSERLLISYSLPRPERITIEIRDITGKLLYQLAREASGREAMEIIWNSLPGSSTSGSGGIYLLTLRTGNLILVKKLVKQ
jgi:hypothetical protein